jgi:hypothetical protein
MDNPRHRRRTNNPSHKCLSRIRDEASCEVWQNNFRIAVDPPRISSSVPDVPLLFSLLTRLRGLAGMRYERTFSGHYFIAREERFGRIREHPRRCVLASEVSELRGTL